MAANAATLFMLTGDDAYREHAKRIASHLASNAIRDAVGTASLQSAFDTILRGRLAFVMGEGDTAEALLRAALVEADPALFTARIAPEAIRTGHPAAGKVPTNGSPSLFLCDATSCLPEIASPEEAESALTATRRGLA